MFYNQAKKSAIAVLNDEVKAIIANMEEYFIKLGGYIEAALSVESAVRLNGSIELCKFLHIPDKEILHSTQELDDFILS